jgi:hypothetical protein
MNFCPSLFLSLSSLSRVSSALGSKKALLGVNTDNLVFFFVLFLPTTMTEFRYKTTLKILVIEFAFSLVETLGGRELTLSAAAGAICIET